MKTRFLFLITSFLIVSFMLAGCSRSSEDERPDDKPAGNTGTASIEDTELEEELTEEETEPEDELKPEEGSADIKIYRKFFDIVSDADKMEWDGFRLIDLDDDRIYELFATCIDGEREDPGIQPYMIVGHKDGETVISDELSDGVAGAGGYRGTLYYLEGRGILHESMYFAPLEEPADRVYSLKDGEIVETDMGEFTADRTADAYDDDWDLFENGEWRWNGKIVTEDEYKDSLREATYNMVGEPLSEIDWISREQMLDDLQSLIDGNEPAEGTSYAEETAEASSEIDKEGEPYCGVLYWYKELQDSGKSAEEMEEYNSGTALVQHGWPNSTDNDEVRYVYQDITGDGLIELIITYYGDPVDIYSNDGDAVYAYGVPYRAIAEIYPDGTIMEGLTMGTKGWRETWYRYDDETFKYVATKEKTTTEASGITFPEGKRISDVVVPHGIDLIE